MAAMRFEQVQRFILTKKIFWGKVHFKRREIQEESVSQTKELDCQNSSREYGRTKAFHHTINVLA